MGTSHSSHTQYRQQLQQKNKFPKGYHRNAKSVNIPRKSLDPNQRRQSKTVYQSINNNKPDHHENNFRNSQYYFQNNRPVDSRNYNEKQENKIKNGNYGRERARSYQHLPDVQFMKHYQHTAQTQPMIPNQHQVIVASNQDNFYPNNSQTSGNNKSETPNQPVITINKIPYLSPTKTKQTRQTNSQNKNMNGDKNKMALINYERDSKKDCKAQWEKELSTQVQILVTQRFEEKFLLDQILIYFPDFQSLQFQLQLILYVYSQQYLLMTQNKQNKVKSAQKFKIFMEETSPKNPFGPNYQILPLNAKIAYKFGKMKGFIRPTKEDLIRKQDEQSKFAGTLLLGFTGGAVLGGALRMIFKRTIPRVDEIIGAFEFIYYPIIISVTTSYSYFRAYDRYYEEVSKYFVNKYLKQAIQNGFQDYQISK